MWGPWEVSPISQPGRQFQGDCMCQWISCVNLTRTDIWLNVISGGIFGSASKDISIWTHVGLSKADIVLWCRQASSHTKGVRGQASSHTEGVRGWASSHTEGVRGRASSHPEGVRGQEDIPHQGCNRMGVIPHRGCKRTGRHPTPRM